MNATGQRESDPSVEKSSPRKVRFRGLLTVLSVLVTPFLLFVVVIAGGSLGNYGLAKMLFPWTMMSTAVTKTIMQPYIAIAVVQYPLYGVILDVALARGHLMPVCLTLLAVHLAAIMLGF